MDTLQEVALRLMLQYLLPQPRDSTRPFLAGKTGTGDSCNAAACKKKLDLKIRYKYENMLIPDLSREGRRFETPVACHGQPVGLGHDEACR